MSIKCKSIDKILNKLKKLQNVNLTIRYMFPYSKYPYSISYDYYNSSGYKHKLYRFKYKPEKLNSVLAELVHNLNVLYLLLAPEDLINGEIIGQMAGLIHLTIENAKVTGILDLNRLTALKTVSISSCTDPIVIRMDNCTNLESVTLETAINSTVAQLDLSKCTLLEELTLSGCLYADSIPLWLSELKYLTEVKIDNCSIIGPMPKEVIEHLLYPGNNKVSVVNTDIKFSKGAVSIDLTSIDKCLLSRARIVHHEDVLNIQANPYHPNYKINRKFRFGLQSKNIL